MENILEIEGLNKTYDSFQLKNIDLKIPKGSIMGLIGENGAGKSTIIKTMLNIARKDSGKVRIFSMDMDKNEKEIKERLGVVLDEKNFQDSFTPEIINKIMKKIYTNWQEDRFTYYLEKFSLKKDQEVKGFSKGMKMKLAISVALSNENDLLILDEPTAGLDPVVRNEILDELLEYVQDENKSVLFSTHITSDLDKIADYISFVHKGEMIFSESSQDLILRHGLIKCSLEESKKIDQADIVGYRMNKFGYEGLVSDKEMAKSKYPGLIIDPVNIEEIMLYYIRGEK